MKILGKNVYIGNLLICTEYTSRIIGGFEDCHVGEKSHVGEILEKNVLFIQDKNGLFVKVQDTEGLGSIALKVFGAAPRYKTSPHDAGDQYIEIKHYFEQIDYKTKYDLKELLEISKRPDLNIQETIEIGTID